jgi:hypothetical protein
MVATAQEGPPQRRDTRHRIRVRAKDTAGNFSRKVVRFRRCR